MSNSEFVFEPAATPGRWKWQHRATGIKGETSEQFKKIVDDLQRIATERRARQLDELRADHTARLEAALAKVEDARDEGFLLGFAAGKSLGDARPSSMTFDLDGYKTVTLKP